ncbi:hypothetical protein FRB93_011637 [Tulasnella sp. JGI-2019a]|nr:hypothetical protein FRB93_011637 [Tulasnella sp. JGI-2019a]
MTTILASNPAIMTSCPKDSISSPWGIESVPGPYKMARGTGCYMQYHFNTTGISVLVEGNFDHGWYSCALDGNPPQWFNANSNGDVLGKRGCYLQGASAGNHTLTITHGPQSGWALGFGNITLSNGPAENVTTFNSDWAGVTAPASYAASYATYSTSTPHHNSTAVFLAVIGVLGLLALLGLIAVVCFWRRERHYRQQLRWATDMLNGTIPFTDEPGLPPPRDDLMTIQAAPYDGRQNNTESIQLEAPSMVGSTFNESVAEPSPAYTPSAEITARSSKRR